VINAWSFLNYWGHVPGLPPKSTPMSKPIHSRLKSRPVASTRTHEEPNNECPLTTDLTYVIERTPPFFERCQSPSEIKRGGRC